MRWATTSTRRRCGLVDRTGDEAVRCFDGGAEAAGVLRRVLTVPCEDCAMPRGKEYTAEFKAQAVRFVFEEIEPDETRSHACERLAPRLSMSPATLMNWVKAAGPTRPRATPPPGSVEELRAQVTALK